MITTTDADHVPASHAADVALIEVSAGTAVRRAGDRPAMAA